MTKSTTNLKRRSFLKGSGALVVSALVPALAFQKSALASALKTADAGGMLNAFVRIAADNTVTVLIKHIEFGQGPFTGLATLVAEELDADWSQMRAEHAPVNAKLYVNAAFGIQGTGGSTAMFSSFIPLRQAGATARSMLVAAAADTWNVKASEITVSKGVVSHQAAGMSATFGELAEKASSMPVPQGEPTLKKRELYITPWKAVQSTRTTGKRSCGHPPGFQVQADWHTRPARGSLVTRRPVA